MTALAQTDAAAVAASRPRRFPGRRNPRSGRDTFNALAFLAPFMLVYALFLIVPVAQALYMSAFNWDLLGSAHRYIGSANYTRMLWGTDIVWSPTHKWLLRLVILAVTAVFTTNNVRRQAGVVATAATLAIGLFFIGILGLHPSATGRWNDPGFWIALNNTLTFTIFSTPILVAVGLGLALALNGKHKASGFYRALFFLPYVLPISAVTLIWSYLLNPDRGLIAGFLGWFGVSPISFLTDPHLAMPSIIATTVWWSVGFNLVLFLAGLQDIDPSLHEAASIDGANAWQRFRHIVIPGLRHATVLVVITQLIASFQIFGQVYIMTKGGPGTATQVVIQHIYEAGFKNYQLGYAATVSVFLFVVMAAVSAVQFRLMSKES